MRRVLPWLLAIGLVGLPLRVARADDAPWSHPYVLARGVGHWEWRRSGPDEDIRVTTIARGAPVRVTPVLSNDEVAEDDVQRRLELTSSMCTRVAAVACVNGDFSERPGNGQIKVRVEIGRGEGHREDRRSQPVERADRQVEILVDDDESHADRHHAIARGIAHDRGESGTRPEKPGIDVDAGKVEQD